MTAQKFFLKYQLILFFLLTYLLSWFSAPFMGGRIIPYGPALAAVIVLAISADRHGLSDLRRRITNWRVAWYWYLIGPAIILSVQALGFVINLLLGAKIATAPQLSIGTILQLAILGGWWEEIGWSGYALPTLQDRFANRSNGPLLAALVLGVFRCLWHLPLFLYGQIFWFDIFLFNMAFQLLIAWLFNRSRGSVPVVMVFHFTSNIVGAIMYPVFAGPDRITYYALFMGLTGLIALVIAWKSGPSLGKREPEKSYTVSPVS